MRRKFLITVVMLLAVTAAALAVRVFYVLNVMDKVDVDSALLELAQIKESGIAFGDIFAGGVSVRTVYALCLSFFCMLFGNSAAAGVYLNVMLQVIAAVLIFGAGTNFLNRYAGLAAGVVFSVLPVVTVQASAVNETNALIILAAAALWLVSAAVYAIRSLCRAGRKKSLEERMQEEQETGQETENEQEQPAPAAAGGGAPAYEITLAQVKDGKPRFIENPLPLPKRRAHKEMDYALAVDENDDFDIQDIDGKDFFDIE